jgi:transcriptional regulator with XRE-family HTH domain
MEIRSVVAWNLRRLRVIRGVSQDDLALTAGLERAYVGHLERGGRNPTVLTLAKLAEALECHVTELLADPPEQASRLATLPPGRKGAGR